MIDIEKILIWHFIKNKLNSDNLYNKYLHANMQTFNEHAFYKIKVKK